MGVGVGRRPVLEADESDVMRLLRAACCLSPTDWAMKTGCEQAAAATSTLGELNLAGSEIDE